MLLFQDTTVEVVETLNYSRMLWEMSYIVLTWGLLLLGVGYNKNRDTFSITTWLKTNVTRFIIGFVFTVGLVFLNASSQDISSLLRLLGFTTEKTTISFGIAIALFLLGGLSPRPLQPQEDDKDPETK